MNIAGSFGITYLVGYFAHWGFFVLMMPLMIGVLIATYHFEQMEKKQGQHSTTFFYESRKRKMQT